MREVRCLVMGIVLMLTGAEGRAHACTVAVDCGGKLLDGATLPSPIFTLPSGNLDPTVLRGGDPVPSNRISSERFSDLLAFDAALEEGTYTLRDRGPCGRKFDFRVGKELPRPTAMGRLVTQAVLVTPPNVVEVSCGDRRDPWPFGTVDLRVMLEPSPEFAPFLPLTEIEAETDTPQIQAAPAQNQFATAWSIECIGALRRTVNVKYKATVYESETPAHLEVETTVELPCPGASAQPPAANGGENGTSQDPDAQVATLPGGGCSVATRSGDLPWFACGALGFALLRRRRTNGAFRPATSSRPRPA